MLKEAYLYRPLSDGAVQGRVCEHFCAIGPGEFGKCGVRCNEDGPRRAHDIGREAGLHYVYPGNVMDPDRGTTYCPSCREILIQRHWYVVQQRWKERGRCPACGHPVPGV